MRKRFTTQFKAEVARELLREEKPMSRIASERGVAATQLNEWKATASKGLVRLFEDEQRDIEKLRAAHEEERATPSRVRRDRATDYPVDLAEKKSWTRLGHVSA